jgi:hypothetical protein
MVMLRLNEIKSVKYVDAGNDPPSNDIQDCIGQSLAEKRLETYLKLSTAMFWLTFLTPSVHQDVRANSAP